MPYHIYNICTVIVFKFMYGLSFILLRGLFSVRIKAIASKQKGKQYAQLLKLYKAALDSSEAELAYVFNRIMNLSCILIQIVVSCTYTYIYIYTYGRLYTSANRKIGEIIEIAGQKEGGMTALVTNRTARTTFVWRMWHEKYIITVYVLFPQE